LLPALLLATAVVPVPPDVARHLVGGALTDGVAYARLRELTDTIGPRLSGSPAAEAAVQWGLKTMRQDGLAARLEPVKVPHWVRGEESGEILPSSSSAGHRLALTALGNGVGGAATAEVVEAHSLAEVAALGAAARGKIVFFNHTMTTPEGYGQFVEMRSRGPSAAARVGAVAVLLRSLSTASLRSPHTGMTSYSPDAPRIPAAAVSTEDADLLHRLLQRGPVRVRLSLGCRMLPDADSANVVADVPGRERPDEVVLIGAHLDSWDLGTGANDDGAGVVMVMEAGRLVASLPQRPRRTLRVVLFMNEENGLAGGKAYAAAHQAELGKHVAALEADSGAARPLSIRLRAGEGGVALLAPWLAPLETAMGLRLESGEAGGADLSPMEPASIPLVVVHPDGTHYFDIHHTAADTLDKIDPTELAKNAAAIAMVAWSLAEMPEVLPRPPRQPPRENQGAPRPAAH
jgi:Zn-dependent M28 family amino/carboxypeptidase